MPRNEDSASIDTLGVPLRCGAAYWLLLAGAVAWTAAALGAPLAAHAGWPGAEWIYAFYAPVCHQVGERSFQCFGHAAAICHRCAGLYLGFVLGLLAMPGLPRLRAFLFAHPRTVLLAAAPMVVDVFAWQNVWWSRFATGLVAAFPVSLFVWAAATQLTHRYRALEETP